MTNTLNQYKVGQIVTISGKQLYAIHKHQFELTKIVGNKVNAKLVKPSKHSLILTGINIDRLTLISE